MNEVAFTRWGDRSTQDTITVAKIAIALNDQQSQTCKRLF